jgi:hypothetical protein
MKYYLDGLDLLSSKCSEPHNYWTIGPIHARDTILERAGHSLQDIELETSIWSLKFLEYVSPKTLKNYPLGDWITGMQKNMFL